MAESSAKQTCPQCGQNVYKPQFWEHEKTCKQFPGAPRPSSLILRSGYVRDEGVPSGDAKIRPNGRRAACEVRNPSRESSAAAPPKSRERSGATPSSSREASPREFLTSRESQGSWSSEFSSVQTKGSSEILQKCPHCEKRFRPQALASHRNRCSYKSQVRPSSGKAPEQTSRQKWREPSPNTRSPPQERTEAFNKQRSEDRTRRSSNSLTCKHHEQIAWPCLQHHGNRRTESNDSRHSSVASASPANLSQDIDVQSIASTLDLNEDEEEEEDEQDVKGKMPAVRYHPDQQRYSKTQPPWPAKRKVAGREHPPDNRTFRMTASKSAEDSPCRGSADTRSPQLSPPVQCSRVLPKEETTFNETNIRDIPTDRRTQARTPAYVPIVPRKDGTGIPGGAAMRPPQDERGYIAVIDTCRLKERAEEVMKNLRVNVTAPPDPDGRLLRQFFKKEVKVPRADITTVENSFHRFREVIRDRLKTETSWEWAFLNSGSHYDGTKVTRANEIDCMFFPKIPESWLETVHAEAPAEFCFLKLRRCQSSSKFDLSSQQYAEVERLYADPRHPKYISSEIFRTKTFATFRKATKEEYRSTTAEILETKLGSPSLSVRLKVIPSPEGKKPVDIDLVPSVHLNGWPANCTLDHIETLLETDRRKIKGEGYYVVPKECQEEDYKEKKHLLWRLSFSAAEKQLTKTIPKTLPDTPHKTCWKPVLRMVKRTLELITGSEIQKRNPKETPPYRVLQLKNAAEILRNDFQRTRRGFKIQKFTTYQIRTLMWADFYLTTAGAHLWAEQRWSGRLHLILDKVMKMMSGELRVHHFFVPGMDIMDGVPQDEREFLYIMFFIAQKLFRTAAP